MNLKPVGKILGIVVIVILSIMVLFFSSCGATRTVTRVQNAADGTTTSITSTTNGSTTSTQVNVVPPVTLDSLAKYLSIFPNFKKDEK